jgi:hypothetical protein
MTIYEANLIRLAVTSLALWAGVHVSARIATGEKSNIVAVILWTATWLLFVVAMLLTLWIAYWGLVSMVTP